MSRILHLAAIAVRIICFAVTLTVLSFVFSRTTARVACSPDNPVLGALSTSRNIVARGLPYQYYYEPTPDNCYTIKSQTEKRGMLDSKDAAAPWTFSLSYIHFIADIIVWTVIVGAGYIAKSKLRKQKK